MKPILILAALLLLTVGAVLSQFTAHVANAKRGEDAIAPVGIPANVDQSDEAGPEVDLLLLALWPEGFDTTEKQLQAGEYVLVIGNRTGLREISVRLDREQSERVAASVIGGRQRDWKQRLRLTTGTYIVTANDNPDWTCRIVVRP